MVAVDTLTRISLLLGVHVALVRLLPNAPDGRMAEMRRFLEAEAGGGQGIGLDGGVSDMTTRERGAHMFGEPRQEIPLQVLGAEIARAFADLRQLDERSYAATHDPVDYSAAQQIGTMVRRGDDGSSTTAFDMPAGRAWRSSGRA